MGKMVEAENQVSLFRPVDVDKLKVEGNSIREFTQVLKIQFVNDWSEAQVVFDRQHKKNMRLSKPVGYIRFNSALDCVKLSAMFLAAASVLAGRSTKNREAKKKIAISALSFYRTQVEDQAKTLLGSILLKLGEDEK